MWEYVEIFRLSMFHCRRYTSFSYPQERIPPIIALDSPAQPHHRPFIATPLRRRRRRGEEQTRRHRGVGSTFRGRVQGPGGARAFAGQDAEVVAAELHDGLNHFLGVCGVETFEVGKTESVDSRPFGMGKRGLKLANLRDVFKSDDQF